MLSTHSERSREERGSAFLQRKNPQPFMHAVLNRRCSSVPRGPQPDLAAARKEVTYIFIKLDMHM